MNLGDYDGRTALHLAVAEGHMRCVRFLLDTCKAKSDVRDRWGHTPLQEAINFKQTKIAALLKRSEKARMLKGAGLQPKVGKVRLVLFKQWVRDPTK